jgi:hypothetical protein
MKRNRTINFTPSAKEAAECELDFCDVPVRLRHASKDLCGVVKTVVDEMVETDVVVAREPNGPGSAIATA